MNSVVRIVLVFLLFGAALAGLQFSTPYLVGFDGYYHITLADIFRTDGIPQEFPWTQESILSVTYADIQFLFHVLLIPFTFFDIIVGAKIAAVLFSAILFATLYWYLRQRETPYAFFWPALLFVASADLLLRYLFTRPISLAFALVIVTLFCLEKKKYITLLITSAFFAWLYSGFIIQLFIVGFYVAIDAVFNQKVRYQPLLFSAIGSVIALIAHPHIPHNIALLVSQVIEVNLLGNIFNVEWEPWPILTLLKETAIGLVLVLVSMFVLSKSSKINKIKLYFLMVTAFFFVYTAFSRRMHEYFVPFAVITAAIIIGDYLRDHPQQFKKGLTIGSMTVIILALGYVTVSSTYTTIQDNTFLQEFDSCTAQLQSIAAPGSLVFNNAYTFPYLFYKNRDLRYTHGLDLTYSELYNSDRFLRYSNMLQGRLFSRDNKIVADYDPEYVFLGKLPQDQHIAQYIISFKDDYETVYEDDWCAVLAVV